MIKEHIQIDIPEERIGNYCQRHHIRRLAFFGSVIRDDFSERSDVDVLVEFEKGHVPGLIHFAGIERELTEILGRKVDLNTIGFLSPYFREEALSEAQEIYVQT